jgi:outer membrane receptor protein involved in Fe transport
LVTAPPQNPDAFEFERFPERFFHDVRVTFEVNDQFTFSAGVDNITDQLPPFGLTGGGAGSGIFNNTGRFGFAGFSANF